MRKYRGNLRNAMGWNWCCTGLRRIYSNSRRENWRNGDAEVELGLVHQERGVENDSEEAIGFLRAAGDKKMHLGLCSWGLLQGTDWGSEFRALVHSGTEEGICGGSVKNFRVCYRGGIWIQQIGLNLRVYFVWHPIGDFSKLQ